MGAMEVGRTSPPDPPEGGNPPAGAVAVVRLMRYTGAMKVVKNPRNFLEELGRWAYPETPEGKRAADITTWVLIGVALIGLVWSIARY